MIKKAIASNGNFKKFVETWSDDEIEKLVDQFDYLVLKQGEKLFGVGTTLRDLQFQKFQKFFDVNTGEESSDLFIQTSGGLEVINENGDLVATITGVECVGELGFLQNSRRSATVIAKKHSILYKLSRSDFVELTETVDLYVHKIPAMFALSKEARLVVARYAKLESHELNTTVAQAGTLCNDTIYFILTGSVTIGDRKLKRGDYFGSEQVLRKIPLGASVIVADGDTKLFALHADGVKLPEFSPVVISLKKKAQRAERSKGRVRFADSTQETLPPNDTENVADDQETTFEEQSSKDDMTTFFYAFITCHSV